MNRRDMLIAAAAAPLVGAGGAALADAHETSPQLLEWTTYTPTNNATRGRLIRYLSDAVIPALNRAGASPVGLFRPVHGGHGLDVYLLAPHASSEAFMAAWDAVSADPAVVEASAGDRSAPLYDRMETSVMAAFSHLPNVVIPEAISGVGGRIFELRIYEAHSLAAHRLKVEMFNEGGEIDIFHKVGLDPVFFGRTLAGPLMPNLTYMLGFEDMAARDAAWDRFRADPDWEALSAEPRYEGTVSAITDIILAPLPASQI